MSFALGVIEKTPSKLAQSCAILCLTKIVINCPTEILAAGLHELTERFIGLLKMRPLQTKQQLLDCLSTIIFQVEEEFQTHCEKFIWCLIDVVKSKDPKTAADRRAAIDTIHALACVCGAEVAQYGNQILQILDKVRSDKN